MLWNDLVGLLLRLSTDQQQSTFNQLLDQRYTRQLNASVLQSILQYICWFGKRPKNRQKRKCVKRL